MAGQGSKGSQPRFAVLAYAAATGKLRWLRYYTRARIGQAMSVAVSPDGKTVYAAGSAGPSLTSPAGDISLAVAYRATGTQKWASRYTGPAGGYAAGFQIVTGAKSSAVYVGANAWNKAHDVFVATLAYRAGTGKRMWLNRVGGGTPSIAVTPDGRTMIATGPRASTYGIAAYDASTGKSRWTRAAPVTGMFPSGLVIDPRSSEAYIGGYRLAAYSVATGKLLWIASGFPHGSIFGHSADGARLFGAAWNGHSIITVAYQSGPTPSDKADSPRVVVATRR
ncbi:MAG: outer membrane protein assembly factor BamB family protein [Streptosporangiaceae bacterium]